MKRPLLLIPLAVAVAVLAGCSSTDERTELASRVKQLELDNQLLSRRLDTLTRDLEPLAERLHQVNEDNRRLTQTLAQVEQDLRSRLHEMVQQESGGGRRRFARAVPPAAAEPAEPAEPPQPPRPYLGFDAQALSAEIAEGLKLAVKAGLLVTDVREGAPAAAGGLRKDDVVVMVDGSEVATKGALAVVVGKKKPGDPVTLALLREGHKLELTITLGRR